LIGLAVLRAVATFLAKAFFAAGFFVATWRGVFATGFAAVLRGIFATTGTCRSASR